MRIKIYEQSPPPPLRCAAQHTLLLPALLQLVFLRSPPNPPFPNPPSLPQPLLLLLVGVAQSRSASTSSTAFALKPLTPLSAFIALL